VLIYTEKPYYLSLYFIDILYFFSFQIGWDMGMNKLLDLVLSLCLDEVQYFYSRSKEELGSLSTCLFLLTWPIDQT